MILNLLIGIIISFLAYYYGVLPFVFGNKKIPENPFFISLIGIGILGIFSQFILLGGKADSFSLLVIIIGGLVIKWRYAHLVQTETKKSLIALAHFPETSLYAFLICSILIAYQSAQVTKINDMGMYYLQTIKWVESYGLVKGIANLHPAYGLFSAWHSLTALFSCHNFLTAIGMPETLKYLGLNGLLLSLSLGYFLWEGVNKPNSYLFIYSLISIFLGFLYLSAPSPDLPIIIYTGLLVYLALGKEELNWVIFILSCFAFSLKPPALLPVIIGLLAFKNLWLLFKIEQSGLSQAKKIVRISSLLLMPILLLAPLIYKNHIVSGHILYPMSNQSFSSVAKYLPKPEWQVPADWNQAYRTGIINWGNKDDFSTSVVKTNIQNNSIINQFTVWWLRAGYKGLVNKLISFIWIFGFVILLLHKSKRLSLGKTITNTMRFFIGLTLLILVIEWLILRQYRLLLPSTIVLSSLSLGLFIPRKISEKMTFLPSIILVAFLFLSFIPFSLMKDSSRNKQITNFEGFEPRNLILPFYQYQDTSVFKGYCWDKPLPCQSVSHRQFLHQFGYEVQSLGNSTSEGFKMVSVKK